MADLYLLHEDALKDRFKNEFDLDIRETINNMDPITLNKMDDVFVSKSFGYKDAFDYHYKCACSHLIPGIRVPTLFMNALDDPMVGKEVIEFEGIKNNENCILGTNKHGGHMGYFESAISNKQWC